VGTTVTAMLLAIAVQAHKRYGSLGPGRDPQSAGLTVPSLAPLTVVIPLLAAASLVGAVAIAPRLLHRHPSIAVAAAVAVLAASLLHASGSDTLVYWFGGWTHAMASPRGLLRDRPARGRARSSSPSSFVVAFVFAYRYFASSGRCSTSSCSSSWRGRWGSASPATCSTCSCSSSW
jgi:hypothetical protein